MVGLIPQEYPFPKYEPKTLAAVLNTVIKMKQYFRQYDVIGVSYSGGSDSDCIVHLICKYFPEYLEKIKFVFVNTGLEYAATKRHIGEIESRYGIHIDRIRGESVVSVVKRCGIPFLSKIKSKRAEAYLRGSQWAVKYVYPDATLKEKMRNDTIFNENQIQAVEFCRANGIMISAKCCDYSKKKPLKRWEKENGIELVVTGERKAEGGQRALHHSCYECSKDFDKFKPLFWWDDDAKADFKKCEGIRFSDCYEVWGMKRTGCVGCPFGKDTAEELRLMYEYEPQLFRACMNVFGQAYELTDRFNCRRKKCLPEFLQMTLAGEIEKSEKEEKHDTV